jgi:hypothetical protein
VSIAATPFSIALGGAVKVTLLFQSRFEANTGLPVPTPVCDGLSWNIGQFPEEDCCANATPVADRVRLEKATVRIRMTAKLLLILSLPIL